MRAVAVALGVLGAASFAAYAVAAPPESVPAECRAQVVHAIEQLQHVAGPAAAA